jgi:hypothetical protein
VNWFMVVVEEKWFKFVLPKKGDLLSSLANHPFLEMCSYAV